MRNDDRVEKKVGQAARQIPGPYAVRAGTDFLLEARDRGE